MVGFKYGCWGRPDPVSPSCAGVGFPAWGVFRFEKRSAGNPGDWRQIASEIKQFDVDSSAERELRLAEKEGVRILTLESEEYSPLLKSIYDPPPILYIQGKPLNTITLPLAVVGTRTPSEYGRLVAERLCLKLASAGFSMISGLARGIDTLAHKAALSGG